MIKNSYHVVFGSSWNLKRKWKRWKTRKESEKNWAKSKKASTAKQCNIVIFRIEILYHHLLYCQLSSIYCQLSPLYCQLSPPLLSTVIPLLSTITPSVVNSHIFCCPYNWIIVGNFNELSLEDKFIVIMSDTTFTARACHDIVDKMLRHT